MHKESALSVLHCARLHTCPSQEMATVVELTVPRANAKTIDVIEFTALQDIASVAKYGEVAFRVDW